MCGMERVAHVLSRSVQFDIDILNEDFRQKHLFLESVTGGAMKWVAMFQRQVLWGRGTE